MSRSKAVRFEFDFEAYKQEIIKRRQQVFTGNASYGYQIGCNNDVLSVLYNHYRTLNNIPKIYPMTDEQRYKWDRDVWNYIRQLYKSVHKQNLPVLPDPKIKLHIKERLTAWEIEKIEDLVNHMNINTAKEQLGIIWKQEIKRSMK